MDFQQKVREAFLAGGALSGVAEQFLPREGQTRMAQAVGRAIDEGGVLVVEAGTGVGKTFSYLVPALLSGERVLISTATKTLQDQLFGRDLPRVAQALGVPLRMALLKGRSSYICLHRLKSALRNESLADEASVVVLGRIDMWSQQTRAGDLAELIDLDERSVLISQVTSTRENCLGAQCPESRACHVNLARREAMNSDVVVVNHHLFFADLSVRESGMAELLPTVRTVIFDEAHQLNEIGVQFLGIHLSTGHLLDFGRDLHLAGIKLARGMADWTGLVAAVEAAAQDLRLAIEVPSAGRGRLRWSGKTPQGIHEVQWQDLMARVADACEHCRSTLEALSEMGPDFDRLQERARELTRRADLFSGPGESDVVRWIEFGSQIRLVQAPLDIAQTVATRVLKFDDHKPERQSWIFTSATLGADKDMRFFTEACGLTHATIMKVESPFDYSSQSCVYVPRHLPRPDDPVHSHQVAKFASSAAHRIGGRTLVLTTTLRALRTIGDALRVELRNSGIDVIVQGELPKRVLIDRFRQAKGCGKKGCILVASVSFWEGIDVPGDALQLVIIDKLPFPPPDDPLVEARSRRLEESGRSAFSDYLIPAAAVALKQGAGRLIRRETDRGVLVLGDTRLLTMGYGKRLLAALPPMRRLVTDDEFQKALEELTRVSTKALIAT